MNASNNRLLGVSQDIQQIPTVYAHKLITASPLFTSHGNAKAKPLRVKEGQLELPSINSRGQDIFDLMFTSNP